MSFWRNFWLIVKYGWPFKSNFWLIAENTTKYYLELKSRYKDRFENDTSLLVTAGVLDAQNYVFSRDPVHGLIFASSPKINIEDIVNLARESTDGSRVSMRKLISMEEEDIRIQKYRRSRKYVADFLFEDFAGNSASKVSECTDERFDFVFGLELLILSTDSSPSRVAEACRHEHKTIEKAIAKTINRYEVGEGLFARATTSFMENASYQSIRQKIGILE